MNMNERDSMSWERLKAPEKSSMYGILMEMVMHIHVVSSHIRIMLISTGINNGNETGILGTNRGKMSKVSESGPTKSRSL